MNVFEFVLGIIVVATVAGLLRLKMGVRRDYKGNEYAIHDDAETARLRDEVKSLKERLAVIERITVEKENSLEREIDRLRDR
jgi:hypothetical protein